jgi:hypothetical protein
MNSGISYATTIIWAATIAASVTLTTHITQSKTYADLERREVASKAAARVAEKSGIVRPEAKMSAAYRDGLYVGKLHQERGENNSVSVGRWATQDDRSAFSAGYLEARQIPVR